MLGPEAMITKGIIGSSPQKLAVMAGGGAFFGLFGAAKPWVILGPNEVAVKTRFGRTVRQGWMARLFKKEGVPYGTVKEPGFHLVPSVAAKKVLVGSHSDRLENFKVDTNNDEQIEVAASYTWGISPDGARLSYEKVARDGADLMQIANSICAGGLRAVMDGRPKAEMKDNETIHSQYIKHTFAQAASFGIEFRETFLQSVSESAPQKLGAFLVRAHNDGFPEGNGLTPEKVATAIVVGMPDEETNILEFGRPAGELAG